jgi:hypothetical protein
MCTCLFLGRDIHNHNHKEGKVMKEEENMVDTKSLRLDSSVIDGTQAQTYAYMSAFLYFHFLKTAQWII